MKITVLGTGYVGLVTGTCFAEMGNRVTCVDTDKAKIILLNEGKVPIYEPGLDTMIDYNIKAGRLSFTSDTDESISRANVVFICVGTPPGEDGSADLQYVLAAAKKIGQLIEGYTVVVTKSTVPVGTTRKVYDVVRKEIDKRKSDAEFDVVNNPEFLKEGSAVADFMGPDRVVIGTDSDKAANIMHKLYSSFLRTDDRVITMAIESSELTKYASNAMLATRISFMNEVAALAEKVGADIEQVRKGMARDRRIGKYFLYAGAGFGGSCFPKDLSALIRLGSSNRCDMQLANAVYEVNKCQKLILFDKVMRFYKGNIKGRKIAMWGLAFKPETDDIREAPSIEIINALRKAGAKVAVTDPQAIANTLETVGNDSVTYHIEAYETLQDADALILMTEWKEYRTPDWARMIEMMKNPVVFDGRNLFDQEDLKKQGFRYFGIGHGEMI